jgi:DNA-binding CsgD family transcriptional regulator
VASRDPEKGEPTPLYSEVPATDPVHGIIASILQLVPVTHWSFVRIKEDGYADQLLSNTGTNAEFTEIKRRFLAQRERVGSSIAASGHSAPYASGLTLLFADYRARFGFLTLLRTEDLGPFTSSEIGALTLALDAASDRLSELRLMESQDTMSGFRPESDLQALASSAAEGHVAEEYVLDRDLQIVLAWTSKSERQVATTPLQTRLNNHLPLVIEQAVREMTSMWTDDATTQRAGVAQPVAFLVVRTRPMSGPTGLFIGVSVERSKPRHSLTRAAARFQVSPREVQVLALLLDGASLRDVGEALHITSSTVQDHIKSLKTKTETRNRSEMLSRILGWK